MLCANRMLGGDIILLILSFLQIWHLSMQSHLLDTTNSVQKLVERNWQIMFLHLHAFVQICKLGCRHKRQATSQVSTTNITLRRLKEFVSSLKQNNVDENEEIPHRLIAEDIDYETY